MSCDFFNLSIVNCKPKFRGWGAKKNKQCDSSPAMCEHTTVKLKVYVFVSHHLTVVEKWGSRTTNASLEDCSAKDTPLLQYSLPTGTIVGSWSVGYFAYCRNQDSAEFCGTDKLQTPWTPREVLLLASNDGLQHYHTYHTTSTSVELLGDTHNKINTEVAWQHAWTAH